jgi:hypothetical protein
MLHTPVVDRRVSARCALRLKSLLPNLVRQSRSVGVYKTTRLRRSDGTVTGIFLGFLGLRSLTPRTSGYLHCSR